MAATPDELRYTADHEWVRLQDGRARIGITDYAQEALGDIVFVSLPGEGDRVSAGAECGEIESTKSVSPLICPVNGTVTAVNQDLDSEPEAVNSDPYGKGWMIEVTLEDEDPLADTLDAEAYRGLLG